MPDQLPIPIPRPDPQAPAAVVTAARLVAAFLGGRSAATMRSYGADLDAFARFLGAIDRTAAVDALLSGGPAHANGLALGWKNAMLDGTGPGAKPLAPATIARRLAAI